MKFKIKEGSENYTCSVVRIEQLFEIEGATKIQRALVQGNDVVVSKTVKLHDKMLYFCSGTKLSQEYCSGNDLFDKLELNKNTEKKGFIGSKMRVKSLKLQGIISNGLLMPLESLWAVLDINLQDLKEGIEFTSINDIEICEKYYIPSRNSGTNPQPKKEKLILMDIIVKDQFKFHFNTEHFAKNLDKFDLSKEFVITRKFHGSSLILANLLIIKKLSWIDKLLLKLGVNIKTIDYGFVYSSGKPKSNQVKGVIDENINCKNLNLSFYKENIWKEAYTRLNKSIEKGITIYAEIVGNGIQGSEYTYGFDYEIFVYRITSTNPDGITIEFSWNQVKAYCDKYSIKYVTEYFQGEMVDIFIKTGNIFQENKNIVETLSKYYLNKSYKDCKIDEGIVIRQDNNIWKLKSSNFILNESNQQENEILNIEDEQ